MKMRDFEIGDWRDFSGSVNPGMSVEPRIAHTDEIADDLRTEAIRLCAMGNENYDDIDFEFALVADKHGAEIANVSGHIHYMLGCSFKTACFIIEKMPLPLSFKDILDAGFEEI